MKKIVYVGALFGVMSFGSFAAEVNPGPADGDVDTTSAEIHWTAKIPTVVPGAWVTITGGDGGDIREGVLNVNNDGSFTSDEIPLEIHSYDAETGQVGAPLALNSAGAAPGSIIPASITYQAEDVSFSSEKGIDTTGASAKLSETSIIQSAITPGGVYQLTDDAAWKTTWKVENRVGGEIPTVIAGDKITATTVVRADVAFAAS